MNKNDMKNIIKLIKKYKINTDEIEFSPCCDIHCSECPFSIKYSPDNIVEKSDCLRKYSLNEILSQEYVIDFRNESDDGNIKNFQDMICNLVNNKRLRFIAEKGKIKLNKGELILISENRLLICELFDFIIGCAKFNLVYNKLYIK